MKTIDFVIAKIKNYGDFVTCSANYVHAHLSYTTVIRFSLEDFNKLLMGGLATDELIGRTLSVDVDGSGKIVGMTLKGGLKPDPDVCEKCGSRKKEVQLFTSTAKVCPKCEK